MEGPGLPFSVGRLLVSSSIRTPTAGWVGCHRCRTEAQVYSCCNIQASQGGHTGHGADSCVSSPVPCPPHLCLHLCSLLPCLYLTDPAYLTYAPPPHLDSTHLTWALLFLTEPNPHLTHDQSSISGSHNGPLSLQVGALQVCPQLGSDRHPCRVSCGCWRDGGPKGLDTPQSSLPKSLSSLPRPSGLWSK